MISLYIYIYIYIYIYQDTQSCVSGHERCKAHSVLFMGCKKLLITFCIVKTTVDWENFVVK